MSKEVELDAEIERLEGLAFGIKGDSSESGQSAETDGTVETTPTTKGTEDGTVETVTTPPETVEATVRDWEGEYKSLRSNTDNYKFNTRTELAQLKEKNLSLNKELKSLKSTVIVPKEDIFKDTFSEDDAKIVGPEALAMMQKAASTAADASTKALQGELDKERELRMKLDEQAVINDRQTATKLFLDRLGNVVPDYAEINLDPGFEKFIKSDDPVNGGLRLTHFKNAERSGNVLTVANYMREFRGVEGAKDSLEGRVAPTGNSTPIDTGSTVEKMIPKSEIDKFYLDVSKGVYKGKKDLQEQLEAKYDLAFVSGGINHMR